MFKRILIANRGEIAVRVVRTCREMGITTVALYEAADRSSLHVRLADESVQLDSPADFLDADVVLAIARQKEVDAVHPGYGFLAEEASFIRACEAAGIVFIGPPAEVVEPLRNKIDALENVRLAGFPTVKHSASSFSPDDFDAMLASANSMGYPVIIKSCSGGRGRGARFVASKGEFTEAARQAAVESQAVYGNRRVYLERAILPAYQVGVQVMADRHGNLIHLGEREGSLLQKGQKIVEEAPALCLNETQREELRQTALEIARLFNYENLGTVEFVVDKDGRFYFSEIKARIQVEHPLTEVLTRLDLVREQMRIAAGEPLPVSQEDVWLGGWAMMCRVRAEDPWHNYLPTPGEIDHMRLPGGPEVRVDTYVYGLAQVTAAYDPLIAKLTVWGKNRDVALRRMQRALEDFALTGIPTNLPFLQRVVNAPKFIAGNYDTHFRVDLFEDRDEPSAEALKNLRNLAVAAAVLYVRRNQMFNPQIAERLRGGWHRSSRRLPQ